MDKEENKEMTINEVDLPIKNEEQVDLPEISKEESETSEISIPTIKEEVTSEVSIELPREEQSTNYQETSSESESNVELPTINIANSEHVDDNKPVIEGNSVLDNQADFQSIFNVESEEVPEVKKHEIPRVAPQVEKKWEEPKPLPEDKVLSDEEKKAKFEIRRNNFNGEEATLYQIEEEKEGNPIVVVLFFLALITVILALPFITKNTIFKNGVPTSSTSEEDQANEDQFYYFGRSSVRAKIGNLEFTNFVKHANKDNTYTLTFNISNKQQKAYTFDEKYYVVFYNEDLIVHRALIHSTEAIGANAITSVEININERSYNEADRFKIAEILPASYPSVNLSEAEGEYRILTCKYNKDEMRYYFLDNKLAKIKETYKDTNQYNSIDPNQTTARDAELQRFNDSTTKYYQLSEKYKKIDNFSSIFISSSAEFTMINEFDYKDIPDTVINNLDEYKFFRYNETKDIVAFEMKSLSYNCG